MQNVVAVPLDIEGERATTGDDALVEAARREPAAFAPLYRRYRDRVYWYVRTRTVTEEDAADLTQQIFVRTLDALPRYRPQRGSFAAWLFTIARNTLINFQRRQRPTVTWDLVPMALQPVADHNLEAELLRREDLERLRILFEALDRDTRELLALRFVAGLTAKDIAMVIGKSEAGTRKRLSRTLHSLAAGFEGV